MTFLPAEALFFYVIAVLLFALAAVLVSQSGVDSVYGYGVLVLDADREVALGVDPADHASHRKIARERKAADKATMIT